MNDHFSMTLKANTYGFLTKKWSPPKIQECDLWQGNICVVRCMSLWSMINGHTTPILREKGREGGKEIIPTTNTYKFLIKKCMTLETQQWSLGKGKNCRMRSQRNRTNINT